MAKRTRKTHWTQTKEGRAKMSEAQKKRPATTARNGQEDAAHAVDLPPADTSLAFLQELALQGARARLAEIDKERTMLEQFIHRDHDKKLTALMQRARQNVKLARLDVVGTTGGKATVETKEKP
jgi:hypothetical protein